MRLCNNGNLILIGHYLKSSIIWRTYDTIKVNHNVDLENEFMNFKGIFFTFYDVKNILMNNAALWC